MSSDRTPISRLRRSMLNRHHLAPEPKTKRLVDPATLPSKLHKTPTQKMLEYKYHIQLEDFITHGSLNEIASHFKSDGINRATISKWRKDFKEQKRQIEDAKFFAQFEDKGVE